MARACATFRRGSSALWRVNWRFHRSPAHAASQPVPGAAHDDLERLVLLRSDTCTNRLKNADLFSKSDPVLYCEVRDGGSNEPWKKLGHTGASV